MKIVVYIIFISKKKSIYTYIRTGGLNVGIIMHDIFVAICKGDKTAVQAIIKNPNNLLNIVYTDSHGIIRTPLNLAVSLNYLEIVEIILNSGIVNIDEQIPLQLNGYNATALHEAVLNTNVEMVDYLLRKGANPNIRLQLNEDTWNVLHLLSFNKTAIEQQLVSIALILLRYNADPFCEDLAPYTPYNIALMKEKYSLATTIYNWVPHGFLPPQMLEYKNKHLYYATIFFMRSRNYLLQQINKVISDNEQLKIRQNQSEKRQTDLETRVEYLEKENVEILKIHQQLLDVLQVGQKPSLQKMPSELINAPPQSPLPMPTQNQVAAQQLPTVGFFHNTNNSSRDDNAGKISNNEAYPTFILPNTFTWSNNNNRG